MPVNIVPADNSTVGMTRLEMYLRCLDILAPDNLGLDMMEMQSFSIDAAFRRRYETV